MSWPMVCTPVVVLVVLASSILGGGNLNHDIEDLLEIIRNLELRIIELEKRKRLVMDDSISVDAWYWDH